jgi:hypothetical protein
MFAYNSEDEEELNCNFAAFENNFGSTRKNEGGEAKTEPIVVGPLTATVSTEEEFAGWNSTSDSEFEKAADRHVKKEKELTKYEQFQIKIIAEKYSQLRYSETGCWSIFYDIDKVEAAWEKLKHFYSSGSLPGVIKICRAKFSDPKGKENGVPICAFCGPCQDKDHCKTVGKLLVLKLEHKKQTCNGTYPKFIYFKKNKKGPLFENGPSSYRVRY